jgi:hypothetical protein
MECLKCLDYMKSEVLKVKYNAGKIKEQSL